MQTWSAFLATQQALPYYDAIQHQVMAKRDAGEVVYPPQEHELAALNQCPLDKVKVVILGQDPYHGPGQAHGLSFSVPPGITIPPSLRNIYKELDRSLTDFVIPEHGCLSGWAQQGLLLLNTVLTVTESQAHSHAKLGWQQFTHAVIAEVIRVQPHVVFMLWGSHAQKFTQDILNEGCQHHLILKAPHPSPLSAHRGFLGCGHFFMANEWLAKKGLAVIDWQV